VAADPITDITMGPRFFQVVGPRATTITAFTPDGYITWTNAQIGTNYTVQTARRLGAATNWVDYVQIPVSNNVVTHRLYDPNPPSGMVLIPAGSFTMGDCMGDGVSSDELPLHTVYVSALYMEKNLVTYSLWTNVYQWATNHGYSFAAYAAFGKATNHPVQTINWWDCLKWCNARSEMEGLVPAYYTSTDQTNVYRTGWTNVEQRGSCRWDGCIGCPPSRSGSMRAGQGLQPHSISRVRFMAEWQTLAITGSTTPPLAAALMVEHE
jgi:hypothetical protein